MQDLIENFLVNSRDWKETLGSKKLMEMLKKVQDTSGEEAQMSEDLFQTGDDSIVACVWPASIHIPAGSLDEDTYMATFQCSKIHVTKEGALYFLFEEQHGLKIDRWLDVREADIWTRGLDAAEEVADGSVHETELADFQESIDKAKALIR